MNKVWEIVIERLLAKLEAGVAPWRQTWRDGIAMNLVTRKPYRGLNQLLLSGAPTPYFVTFNQAKAMRHTINKGAESYIVTLWKPIYKDVDGESKKVGMVFRYYVVFNVADTSIKIDEQGIAIPKIIGAEEIVDGYPDGPIVVEALNPAYNVVEDIVKMPNVNKFESSEEYYAALFHELIHSTGHKQRLARPAIAQQTYYQGDHIRSEEELVADIGASFLLNEAGIIINDVSDQTAAYCQSWLNVINKDKSILQRSIMAASKAAKYILQGGTNADDLHLSQDTEG